MYQLASGRVHSLDGAGCCRDAVDRLADSGNQGDPCRVALTQAGCTCTRLTPWGRLMATWSRDRLGPRFLVSTQAWTSVGFSSFIRNQEPWTVTATSDGYSLARSGSGITETLARMRVKVLGWITSSARMGT